MIKQPRIAEFNMSDGFTPLQIAKLNQNFKALAKNLGGAVEQGTYAGEPIVTVESTQTLEAGQDAYVLDVGYPPLVKLRFGIPAGKDGKDWEGDMFRPPAGQVIPYAGTTAPDGWLMCDGSAVSRTQYSELFAVIGTTFGPGDGSTTFNLPDLRGRTTVGVNNNHALGSTGGSEEVTLTKEQSGLPSHGHGFTQPTVNGGATTTGENSHWHEVVLGSGHSTSSAYRVFSSGNEASGYGMSSGGGFVNRVIVYTTNTGNGSRATAASSSHSHSQVAHTHSVSGGAVSDNAGANASQAHDNMQPYASLNYIISTGEVKYEGIKGDPGPVGPQGPKGDKGDPSNNFYIGTSAPSPRGDYVLWYDPLNGALRVWNYVEPDSLTDGGWAWREVVLA